mmetsp:Transcript_130313/g.337952  ORF Transcript_130313/g.337952 Transcript_130313/m.337952 type:complete len:209 (+) Transcript_130313:824-1450(+)
MLPPSATAATATHGFSVAWPFNVQGGLHVGCKTLCAPSTPGGCALPQSLRQKSNLAEVGGRPPFLVSAHLPWVQQTEWIDPTLELQLDLVCLLHATILQDVGVRVEDVSPPRAFDLRDDLLQPGLGGVPLQGQPEGTHPPAELHPLQVREQLTRGREEAVHVHDVIHDVWCKIICHLLVRHARVCLQRPEGGMIPTVFVDRPLVHLWR